MSNCSGVGTREGFWRVSNSVKERVAPMYLTKSGVWAICMPVTSSSKLTMIQFQRDKISCPSTAWWRCWPLCCCISYLNNKMWAHKVDIGWIQHTCTSTIPIHFDCHLRSPLPRISLMEPVSKGYPPPSGKRTDRRMHVNKDAMSKESERESNSESVPVPWNLI